MASLGGGGVNPMESSSWVGGSAGFLPQQISISSARAEGEWLYRPMEHRPLVQGERASGPFSATEAEANSTRFNHIVVDGCDVPASVCSLCVHHLPPCLGVFAWCMRTSTIKRSFLWIFSLVGLFYVSYVVHSVPCTLYRVLSLFMFISVSSI